MESQFFPLSAKEAEKASVLYPSTANRSAGFPTRLRELRDKANISQQKLADEVGVTKSTIGLYENGDNVPDVKTLYKLAMYYGVSADYLLGISDVKATDTNVKAICEYTGLSENTVLRLNEELNKKATFTYLQSLIDCLAKSSSWPKIYWGLNNLKVLCAIATLDMNHVDSPSATEMRNFEQDLWIKSRGTFAAQPIHKQIEQSRTEIVNYLGSIINDLTNCIEAAEIGKNKWIELMCMSNEPGTQNAGGETNAET